MVLRWMRCYRSDLVRGALAHRLLSRCGGTSAAASRFLTRLYLCDDTRSTMVAVVLTYIVFSGGDFSALKMKLRVVCSLQ